MVELNNRWFNGQAVHAELSPVTDFRESCCRQYEMGYGSTAVGWAPGVPGFCCVLRGLSVTVASSMYLSFTQGMYPRWFLQLHAPATHFPRPQAAALRAGTQAQVFQDQPAKTSHTPSPLNPEMNLILCPNKCLSRLCPKTSPQPYLKVSI